MLASRRWQWTKVRIHRVLLKRAFAREDYQRCLRHAEAALRISPEDPGILYTLGAIRGYLQDFAGSIEALGRVLIQQPANTEALALTANAYSQLGDPGLAARFYSRAIDLDGDFGRAFLGRGISRLQMDQAPLAAEDLARSIDLGYNIPVAHAFYSASLLKQGLADEAFKSAKEVLALPLDEPKVVEIASGVCGDVLLARGEYQAATDEYFKAIAASGSVYPDQIVKLGKASLLSLIPGSGIWVVEHLTNVPFRLSFMNWLSRQGLVLAWERPDPVRAEVLMKRVVDTIIRERPDGWAGYDEEVASLFRAEGFSFAPYPDTLSDIPGPLGIGRKGRVLLVSPQDDLGKLCWETSFTLGYGVRILQTIRGATGVMEEVAKGDIAIVIVTSTGMLVGQMEDLIVRLRESEFAASMLVILAEYSEALDRQLTSQGTTQVLWYPHDMPTLGNALERAFEDAIGRKGKILATDDREALSTAWRKIFVGLFWFLFGLVATIGAVGKSGTRPDPSLLSFGFVIYGVLKIAEGVDLKVRRTRPGGESIGTGADPLRALVKCVHCNELLELDDDEVHERRYACPECGKEGKL